MAQSDTAPSTLAATADGVRGVTTRARARARARAVILHHHHRVHDGSDEAIMYMTSVGVPSVVYETVNGDTTVTLL